MFPCPIFLPTTSSVRCHEFESIILGHIGAFSEYTTMCRRDLCSLVSLSGFIRGCQEEVRKSLHKEIDDLSLEYPLSVESQVKI